MAHKFLSVRKFPFGVVTPNCFDLLDQKYLDFLQLAYEDLKETVKAEKNGKLPQNKKFGIEDFDFGVTPILIKGNYEMSF